MGEETSKFSKILIVYVGNKDTGWIPPDAFLDRMRERILPLAIKAGYDEVLTIPSVCEIKGPLYN